MIPVDFDVIVSRSMQITRSIVLIFSIAVSAPCSRAQMEKPSHVLLIAERCPITFSLAVKAAFSANKPTALAGNRNSIEGLVKPSIDCH
jgi:hypothetical protein